ncbi:hypothetical protein BCR35DRAFT_300028 [Leucosporidium creatinivorum]|uniref:C3H1-type domain-containing protein n=1 Tax=Leucosporidium creatinivorum TaxID=106004 RepID=A0A1Y2FZK7_9BASI|nr:hypothetical protein BCR35DRAFT_300028 [Leucosporidium creatinivorum]
MLLNELTVEEAEVWLRDNALDAFDEGTLDCDAQPTSPSPPLNPLVLFHSNPASSGPPTSATTPSLSLRSTSPHVLVASLGVGVALDSSVEASAETSELRDRVLELPRNVGTRSSSAFDRPPATTSTFLVDNLSPGTTSVDLKQLLVKRIDHTLIQKLETRRFTSTTAIRVSLHRPISVDVAQSLDGAELDGKEIRIRFHAAAPPSPSDGPRYASHSSPSSQKPSSPRQRSKKRRSERSLSPPRSSGRRFSYPAGDAFSPESKHARQLPPPPDATQRELDDWAEGAFERRMPAYQPQVPPHWSQGRPGAANVWRTQLCRYFPPKVGGKVCWGRRCTFAHDLAEFRNWDGSVKDPNLAAEFATRPKKLPQISYERRWATDSSSPPQAGARHSRRSLPPSAIPSQSSPDSSFSHEAPQPSSRHSFPFHALDEPVHRSPTLPSLDLLADGAETAELPSRAVGKDDAQKFSISFGYVSPQVAQAALQAGRRFSDDEEKQLAYERLLSSQVGEDREHYLSFLENLGNSSGEDREFAEAAKGALSRR